MGDLAAGVRANGYHPSQAGGDIAEWNVSIYDADWLWPFLPKFSANRVWWQSPWANAMWYDELHIYCRPDVTVHSGAPPVIQPELKIPNGQSFANPVIDGRLTDAVWALAPKFKIQYGNDNLRVNYPGVGRWRAGQYQPTVNGGQAAIADTGANAVVKYFFKNDTLYLGFDVTDQVVQYITNVDRYDGFIVTINDHTARQTLDHNLQSKRLTFQVGPTGQAVAQDSLPNLINIGGARVALAIKSGTTVDTVGNTPDQGYTAELAIVLTKIGYPAGRGDGTVWLGVDWLNGDSYGGDFTSSYATRTWWFRQYENECCPVWAYLDPTTQVSGVGDPAIASANSLAAAGNWPNPFRSRTAIHYRLSAAGDVALEIFDVSGRRVARRSFGPQQPGERSADFARGSLGAGVYPYRLLLTDPKTGGISAVASGRMVLLR